MMSSMNYLTGLVKHSRLPIDRPSKFSGGTGNIESGQFQRNDQANPISQVPDLRPQRPIENLSTTSTPIEDQTVYPAEHITQTSEQRQQHSHTNRFQEPPNHNDVGTEAEFHTQTHRIDTQEVPDIVSQKKTNSDASSSVKALEPIKTSHYQLAQLDGKVNPNNRLDFEGKARTAKIEKGNVFSRQSIKEKRQDIRGAPDNHGDKDAQENQSKISVSAQQVRLRRESRSEYTAIKQDSIAKRQKKNNGVHIGTVNVTVSAPPNTPPLAPIIKQTAKPAPKTLPKLNRSYQRRF